jgi:hypothetical protein
MKSAILTALILFNSQVQGAELIIDWSLDIRNPDQYLSPPLYLVCIGTKTAYSISGTPGTRKDNSIHLYRLPEEVKGRCIISPAAGMEPQWPDGSHEVEIKDPKGLVVTKMPTTSLSFQFKLPKESKALGQLDLYLFKLSAKGMPMPQWVSGNRFSETENGKVINRFIIPYAGAGEYLAYVAEASEVEKPPRYFYAKQFSVTKNNLINHDRHTTINDVLNNQRKTIVQFQSEDEFNGVAAVAFVNKGLFRSVVVNRDGAIIKE